MTTKSKLIKSLTAQLQMRDELAMNDVALIDELNEKITKHEDFNVRLFQNNDKYRTALKAVEIIAESRELYAIAAIASDALETP